MEKVLENVVRNMKAFLQPIDMMTCSDVADNFGNTDGRGELPNDEWFLFEVKKETDAHKNIEEYIKSRQWIGYQRTTAKDVYLIYCTHNEEISEKPINLANTIVRHVEKDGQILSLPEEMTFYTFLNKIGSIGKYCILVHYPNNTKEVALVSPSSGEKWTTEKFISKKCIFNTEEDCIKYIKKRFEKEFNREYTYSIYYRESLTKNKLVHEYTYPETIGL